MILVMAWTVATRLVGRAGEEAYVRRTPLERQGRAWTQELDCAVPMKEGGRLVLRADMGSVIVRPESNNRVQCSVRLQVYAANEAETRSALSHYGLTARRSEGGGAFVEGKFADEPRRLRSLCVTFDVRVPTHFNVDLKTEGGGVEVGKLEGELHAVTAGGSIHTADVRGPVQAETAGGNIDLGNIDGRVEAHTAGGNIHVGDVQGYATLETRGGHIVAGAIQGTVRAQTAGGDIALRAVAGPVIAETAGGQIQLGQCGSNVRAETAAGTIRLASARGKVQAETAGGNIDLLQVMSGVRASTSAGHILAQIIANRNSFAASELETEVGDVQVYVPSDLPLTIEAAIEESAGHKIRSDFPLSIQGEEEDFTAGTVRGHGKLQGGGDVLTLRTAMGNIDIRKLDSRALTELKRSEEVFWKRWQSNWQELRKLHDQVRELQERQRTKDGEDDDDQ